MITKAKNQNLTIILNGIKQIVSNKDFTMSTGSFSEFPNFIQIRIKDKIFYADNVEITKDKKIIINTKKDFDTILYENAVIRNSIMVLI
jgi:hypothetical protein